MQYDGLALGVALLALLALLIAARILFNTRWLAGFFAVAVAWPLLLSRGALYCWPLTCAVISRWRRISRWLP